MMMDVILFDAVFHGNTLCNQRSLITGTYSMVCRLGNLSIDIIYPCSGECSGCGLALDPGDITHEELQLLRQHIDHTLQNMVDQSINAKQEQTKLHVLRAIVEKNNFGAILDGLNIARVFQRQSPSRKQVSLLQLILSLSPFTFHFSLTDILFYTT